MYKTFTHSLFGAVIMPTILASTISINPAIIDPNTAQNNNPIELILNGNIDEKIDQEQIDREIKAAKIDTYFADLPLEGHGMGMVMAAEKYGLDWKILPALAKRETTGGKFACPVTYKKTGDIRYTYNVFGWGSCSIKFDSYEHGFEVLARNLSGNNPKTSRHYANKNIDAMLKAYNPPHIVQNYSNQVIAIMTAIENTSIDTSDKLAMN
jgi:hypothetical protein